MAASSWVCIRTLFSFSLFLSFEFTQSKFPSENSPISKSNSLIDMFTITTLKWIFSCHFDWILNYYICHMNNLSLLSSNISTQNLHSCFTSSQLTRETFVQKLNLSQFKKFKLSRVDSRVIISEYISLRQKVTKLLLNWRFHNTKVGFFQ